MQKTLKEEVKVKAVPRRNHGFAYHAHAHTVRCDVVQCNAMQCTHQLLLLQEGLAAFSYRNNIAHAHKTFVHKELAFKQHLLNVRVYILYLTCLPAEEWMVCPHINQ